jgi:hypothetical protein
MFALLQGESCVEEPVLYSRFALIAVASLVTSSAFAADTAQPPAHPTTEQQRPAQVVLASADDTHSTATASDQSSPAPKRRIARVTTCRCGDPAPSEGDQQ